MRTTEQESVEAVEALKRLAPAGSTIHAIWRGASRSGTTRRYQFYVYESSTKALAWLDPKLWQLGFGSGPHPADTPGNALTFRGGGYNAVAETVTNLSEILHGDSTALNHQTVL